MTDEAKEPMDQLSAHLDRGWDLASRGDIAGATVSAQKSLELDEESPEAHNLMGYVLAAQGRAEDALDHYRIALEFDDTYVDAMLNAAEVLTRPLGEYDEALGLLDETLDLLADDELDLFAETLLLKVEVYLAKGDRDGAARVVQELPEGPFENPGMLLSVGRARFEIGDLERAEPLVRKACEEQPPNPDAFYYLALVLQAKGDQRGAAVGLLQARDLDLASPPPAWTLPRDQFERKVQAALQKLKPEFAHALEGALVMVSDLPGVEVVAEGVDPRIAVLLDDLSEPGGTPRVGRLFVYQHNIERAVGGLFEVEDEIVAALEAEIAASFEGLQTPPLKQAAR